MKYLILLLAFVTTSVFANTVTTQGPSLHIGGRIYTNLTNLKAITCGTVLGATTCADGTGHYDVPAGKQFRIIGIKCMVHGSGLDHLAVGHHTATLNNATPLGTTLSGSWPLNDPKNNVFLCRPGSNSGNPPDEYAVGPFDWIVPAGSFVWIDGTNSTSNKGAIIYGYEETP